MLDLISENKQHGGWHRRFRHHSEVNHCDMQFAMYIPGSVTLQAQTPCLYFLSGLTCTDENVMQKSGIQLYAAQHGIVIIAPDTSPRGEQVANDAAYDLGQGAGFYLNATKAPWSSHYHMYDYIVTELPALLKAEFGIGDNCSISGHSMGGHGALHIALKNPQRYRAISAFSPIVNPVNCAWGKKAFSQYLGDQQDSWLAYDSCHLMEHYADDAPRLPILIDQGGDDEFLAEQLLPQNFVAAAEANHYALRYREHAGYDHSYFFISSFIGEHIAFHAEHLKS